MRDMLNPTLRRRELGVELRVLRTEEGLTEEQVAERMDWSPSKVSRIEKGHPGQAIDGMRRREAVPIPDDASLATYGGLRGSHRRGSRVDAPQRFDQLRARAAAPATTHLAFTFALSAIVDEAALRRVMRCGAVMRVRLEQISRVVHLPNVTIQIVPSPWERTQRWRARSASWSSIAPRPVWCMLRGRG